MEKFKNFVISMTLLMAIVSGQDTEIEEASTGLYQIEGKIFAPEIGDNNLWTQDTQVIFNQLIYEEFLFNFNFINQVVATSGLSGRIN